MSAMIDNIFFVDYNGGGSASFEKASNKLIDTIWSCKTLKQLIVAERMIERLISTYTPSSVLFYHQAVNMKRIEIQHDNLKFNYNYC